MRQLPSKVPGGLRASPFFPLIALVTSFTTAVADESPAVAWGVHTVVTEGRPFYEGEKLRAILVYGEIGNPEITVELIRVEMGYPSTSGTLWRSKIDLTGNAADPCPIAETYCATVEDMRWVSGQLSYAIVAPAISLRCLVSGIRSRSPETRCNPA